MRQEPYPIEPTLMSIFKLFVFAWIVYQLVLITLRVLILENPNLTLPLVYLGVFCAIALYLASDTLRMRLGRYYLPIPLAAAVLVLLLERPLYDWYFSMFADSAQLRAAGLPALLASTLPGSVRAIAGTDSGWNPMLFVPVVLLAWQYQFKYLVAVLPIMVIIRIIISPLLLGAASPDLSDLGLGLAGRLLAYALVGYVVSRLVQALREERNALRLANLRLQDHVATLDQLATSRERNRLARELHDTMAHSLSATAVQLEATQALWDSNAERARKLLQESLAATRAGLTETRRALAALRASPLEDLGLLLALEQVGRAAAERAGCELELQLPPGLDSLPVVIEQTIYRCAQEALANVVKHAAAKHICLQLTLHERQIALTVSDDGVGFDPDRVDQQNHLGLLGIRERVEMLGGEVQVISQPGQGTTIRLQIGY